MITIPDTSVVVTNKFLQSPHTELIVGEDFIDFSELKKSISTRQIELQLDMDEDGTSSEISATNWQASPGTTTSDLGELQEIRDALRKTGNYCLVPGNSYSDCAITVTQNPPSPSTTGFLSFATHYGLNGWSKVDLPEMLTDSGTGSWITSPDTDGDGVADFVTMDHQTQLTNAYDLLTTWKNAAQSEVIASMTNGASGISNHSICEDGERFGTLELPYFRSYQKAVDCMDTRFVGLGSNTVPGIPKIDQSITLFRGEWHVDKDIQWGFRADFKWTPLVEDSSITPPVPLTYHRCR